MITTGYWSPENREIESFEQFLVRFAGMSGRQKLIHAPWIPIRHSNSGQMSYGFNVKRPENPPVEEEIIGKEPTNFPGSLKRLYFRSSLEDKELIIPTAASKLTFLNVISTLRNGITGISTCSAIPRSHRL